MQRAAPSCIRQHATLVRPSAHGLAHGPAAARVTPSGPWGSPMGWQSTLQEASAASTPWHLFRGSGWPGAHVRGRTAVPGRYCSRHAALEAMMSGRAQASHADFAQEGPDSGYWGCGQTASPKQMAQTARNTTPQFRQCHADNQTRAQSLTPTTRRRSETRKRTRTNARAHTHRPGGDWDAGTRSTCCQQGYMVRPA